MAEQSGKDLLPALFNQSSFTDLKPGDQKMLDLSRPGRQGLIERFGGDGRWRDPGRKDKRVPCALSMHAFRIKPSSIALKGE